MPEEGNEEQNERAAERLSGKVLERLLVRHPELRNGPSAGERLMQWLPLAIAIATAFWTRAIQSKQVDENTTDIVKLETRYDQTQALLQSVDSRLARMETTLEIVTGAREQSYARR